MEPLLHISREHEHTHEIDLSLSLKQELSLGFCITNEKVKPPRNKLSVLKITRSLFAFLNMHACKLPLA